VTVLNFVFIAAILQICAVAASHIQQYFCNYSKPLSFMPNGILV